MYAEEGYEDYGEYEEQYVDPGQPVGQGDKGKGGGGELQQDPGDLSYGPKGTFVPSTIGGWGGRWREFYLFRLDGHTNGGGGGGIWWP